MAKKSSKSKSGFSSKKSVRRKKQPSFTQKQLAEFIQQYKRAKGYDSEE